MNIAISVSVNDKIFKIYPLCIYKVFYLTKIALKR